MSIRGRSCPLLAISLLALAPILIRSGLAQPNLLLNSEFHFQSFDNSRHALAVEYRSGSVPFWDQDAYGDAEAFRAPSAEAFRPRFPVDGVVRLHPGKSLRQVLLLSEVSLDPGEIVSLSVWGQQTAPGALRARLWQLQTDSAPGEWSPQHYEQRDRRTFPRRARGELIRVEIARGVSGSAGDFELHLADAALTGSLREEAVAEAHRPNTLGVEVEFTNLSEAPLWIYAPSLVRGSPAAPRALDSRPPPAYYRHLPQTLAKLRRGEPLHLIVMGSSIDRGSANPPLYLYDEDPQSPRYKTPVSTGDFLFDGARVGHPEWTPYIGQWRHYHSYAGRLRLSLMRRFDYPIDKILLNFMACDGSSIGEAHSALAAWSNLELPPNPETNGHQAGPSWQELYPEIFARPQGARPDLVIFGSGANEKIDGPKEIAAFEGAIRWFQRHYPGIEFVFCMWQWREQYTRNTGMLRELALRYGIPFIDLGRELNLALRHVDPLTLTPRDGHPQAAAHYLWGRALERAFQTAEPLVAGQPQAYLPRYASEYTAGWEGEVRTYTAPSPRLYENRAFILDDAVVNVWAQGPGERIEFRVDGREHTHPDFHNGSRLRPMNARNPRNSTFALGRLSLGDRHIVEVSTPEAQLVAVDSKVALQRTWHGVESRRWQLGGAQAEPFVSTWGAPYGSHQAVLAPGQVARLTWVGTDCSVAWHAAAGAGRLVVKIDGVEKWRQPTDTPYTLASGEQVYPEDRRGVRHLPFGQHELTVEAVEGPVALLGAFSYDTRPNQDAQRTLQGLAAPGETVTFSAAFAASPVVLCSGGLTVQSVSRESVTFGGSDVGNYQIVGER